MRALNILALIDLLALAPGGHLGGDEIPLHDRFAIAGDVLVSLLVGGGLTALVFYASRHGHDDDAKYFC